MIRTDGIAAARISAAIVALLAMATIGAGNLSAQVAAQPQAQAQTEEKEPPPPPPTSTGKGYVEYSMDAKAPAPAKPPHFGVVMLGGHGDVDEATQFFCEHSGGGKMVIIRASGDNDYNEEFHEKCPANSTTTIVFSSREGSSQPWVIRQLREAHAIFIAGGDQSNYIHYWKGTPVQDEINAAIKRGVPIAGISAGLAVEGEFLFASMVDTVTTEQALADPYDLHVTLEKDFLAIPQLRGVITDSHYMARGRMGRSITFAARIVQDGWAKKVHVIGIDETTAVLVEADQSARVVGKGAAHVFGLDHKAEVCVAGKPLTLRRIQGFTAPAGATFSLRTWESKSTTPFSADVVEGKLTVKP